MFQSLQTRLAIFSGLLAVLALCFASIGNAHAEMPALSDPPPDQVVVKPKHGIPIDTILARYNATQLDFLSETNIYFLKLPAGQTANQILPALNSDPDLFYAEPNYYGEGSPGGGYLLFGGHMAPVAEYLLFGGHSEGTSTPGGGSSQWAWSKIGLSDAQKISRGQGIIVAVLDTGLAPDHPLLSSSLTAGYDFVGMTEGIYDHGNGLDDSRNGQVDEFVGHGTHVSGIIVTEAPGVQIMPIRVLNSDGVGTYWEVAAGIRYAVDHGAKVINMSLSAPRLTPSLADALAYAASHGVVVVAAAGTGSGPNYPAGYSDPLAVIGVGATDFNDGIPWFSGGRVEDTDVYAPGVDIYSAYPYNGYGLGSGTSMSAPIVSGEVALLKSRYPDWNAVQIAQRILSQTAPVPGRSQGRVNLSAALTHGLELHYTVGDPAVPGDNNLKPHIRLVNNTPEDIPLNQLKFRYWYTIDFYDSQVFNCDHTTIAGGCAGLTSVFLPADSGHQNAVSDTFMEVGFTSNAGYLPAGGQVEMFLRVNKTGWTNYAEANDYSYDNTKTSFTRWDHITLYRNGSLVWGVEPSGGSVTPAATLSAPSSTPSRTATVAAATVSPTRTPTQVPATLTRTPTRPPATVTSTRTATQVSATNTATRAATSTAPPPSVTKTSAPATATPSGGSLVKVQYLAGATAANSQAISPKLILVNTGNSGVPLNEIKIRYWFTREGNQLQSYWCDYAALGCANITGQFVALPTARPGADHYLEIGFTSGAGSLAPGANTGQIHSRFSKNDWSSYVQTGDYSFNAALTQFSDWNHITVYRNGVLIWGIEP